MAPATPRTRGTLPLVFDGDDGDDGGRGPRWATAGVLGLSALLPLVELSRIALGQPAVEALMAAGVLAVCLPLHLRHVAYALRGERPAYAGWSLAVMALLMGWATVASAASWGWMLGSLAVSVLLTVRPPWSLLLLGAVMVGASWEGVAEFNQIDTAHGLYFALAVMFRAVCLFAVIRLVVEVRTLDAARNAVAGAAVEHQRADAALRLTRPLVEDLESIGRRADRLGRPDQAREEIATLVGEARRVLAEVRAIVSRTRGAGAQRDLVDAGRFLRGDAVSGTPIREGVLSPATSLTASIQRSLVLLVLVRVVVVGLALAFAAGVAYEGPLPSWTVTVIAVLSVLELREALRTARAQRPDRLPWPAAVSIAVAAAALLAVESEEQFAFAVLLVGATVAMARPARWRNATVVAALLAMPVAGLVDDMLPRSLPTVVLVWYVVYALAVGGLAMGSMVASARLVAAVRALEETRLVLAERAVDAENRRFARDLHDTFVQSLSAVALTGDLVLRLVDRDPAAAAREVAHLRTVATGLAEDARRVREDQRAVTLADETQVAAQLLRAAGIETDIRVEVTPTTQEADALLGWALREAATNVVRHSSATRCAIAVTQEDGHLGLLVVNDGVRSAPGDGGPAGSGLAGLADRVRELHGSVDAGACEAGQFRLRVRVPEAVS